MDALPRLMICQEKIDGHLVLLNENHRDYRYVLDSLDKLGFKYVFYTNKCRIKELLLPDHVADSGNYLPSVFYKIRTGLLEGFSSKVPFRKIYVSRKTARFRRLLNEAEFVNLLKQYGFEIHYFENYTLKEQIALMQETKYFIGVHGNALANIYFMQPGTNVLELRFDNDKMNNCFFSLAAASQVNYYYQMGTGTSDDTHVADMQINVQEAEAIILRLLTK
jgi:capsular polysaccharide biosynthesis protein